MRTPLTSLRSNWSWSGASKNCRGRAAQVIDDVLADVDELSVLLTRAGDLPTTWPRARETIYLGDSPSGGGGTQRGWAARSRRGHRAVAVQVRPRHIERAIANLVDNCVKYSPGTPIDIAVPARVTVRAAPRRRRGGPAAQLRRSTGPCRCAPPAPGSGCRSSTRSCAATAGRCSPGPGRRRIASASRSPVVRKLECAQVLSPPRRRART